MAKVGILTFSDGRDYVYQSLEEMNRKFQQRLAEKLQADGHKVLTGERIITSNRIAAEEGRRLAAEHVDCTILNYAVWAFPQFTMVATRFAPPPFMTFGCVNPKYPGMVAVLAAAGALNQVGTPHKRVFGEIEDEAVYQQVKAFVEAAECVKKLRGETFGCFGGRSIGINTAVANTDQWMKIFGVDVQHIDQWEIVRRGEKVDSSTVAAARKWLEQNAKKVHYDGKQLTPEKLELQLRAYYAVLQMCEQMGLDFCGIKGQPELTENYATMDVPEAFLNDPYGPQGEDKPIIVCSTEADMDAAMTMEILKHCAKTPVLFADVRHYFADLDMFDLVNSGEHATYFAGRSFDWRENMPHVELKPEGFYFAAGGASVFHVAAPGPVTLARLTRLDGRYWMAIIRGEFVRYDAQKEQKIINEVQDNWPHAFCKLHCSSDEFLQNYAANHIHAVYGDYVEHLVNVCEMLEIEYCIFGEEE